MIKKSELKNGMIVKSSGGRYGVVVLEDATSKNCIKFLYDPRLLLYDGILHDNNYGVTIQSLDEFEEDLTIRWTEEDERKCPSGENNTIDPNAIGSVCWRIESVYRLVPITKYDIKKIKEIP